MTYNTRNCSNDTAESQNEKKNVLMLMQESESVRVELYMQYNISDSQGLLLCFVLIILRIASLNTLSVCSYVLKDDKLGFVLSLFLVFLPKRK